MIKKHYSLKVFLVSLVSLLVKGPIVLNSNNIDSYSSYAPTQEGTFDVEFIDNDFNSNESTNEFNFKTKKQISEIKLESDETLYKIINNDKYINCYVCNFKKEGELRFSFKTIDNLKNITSIYYVKHENRLFFSALSLDTAKRNAGIDVGYSFINAEEENSLYEANRVSNGIGVYGSFCGNLSWRDLSGTIHPLINAQVKITIDGSWWSEVTYTDHNGYYEFIYSDIWYIGSGKPKIHILSKSNKFDVLNGTTYEKTYEANGSSGNFTYNYTFTQSDGDMYKAIVVLVGANAFANYFESLNANYNIMFCNIHYPAITGSRSYMNDIYLKTISDSDFSIDSLFDLLGHEYGHVIETYLEFSILIASGHSFKHNLIDDLSQNNIMSLSKNYGLHLAWREGWATYFSIVAQEHFSSDLKSIHNVGDSSYHFVGGSSCSLNNSISDLVGEGSEYVVARILYKLYNSEINSYDNFNINDITLMNLIDMRKPNILSDFINELYDNGYDRFELGKLLARYNVVTNTASIENNHNNICPTFKRSTSMGSNSLFYNQFDFLAYDSNKNLLFRRNNVGNINNNQCSFTLNLNEWNLIKIGLPRYFYIAIIERETTQFISGNYYTPLIRFEKPLGDFVL